MMSANMTRFYAKLFFEGVGHVHVLCRLEREFGILIRTYSKLGMK
jgi:hypothetical protein